MTRRLLTRLKLLVFVLVLAAAGAGVAGCGGAVNVQASGGGADGFASLGVLMLGTSAIRYIRDKTYSPIYVDSEPLPPPSHIETEHDSEQADPDANADIIKRY